MEIDQQATFDPPIIGSMLPAGRVATTVHRGTYDLLGESHDRLASWAREQGLELAGPRWEIYGHWHEDPRQLETEVTYLLV